MAAILVLSLLSYIAAQGYSDWYGHYVCQAQPSAAACQQP